MQKKKLSALSNRKTLIAPSILAADFAKLGEEIKAIEDAGADVIHIDVMDGHFVPNLTIGPPVLESIRKYSSLPFDVHLMLTNPLKYAKVFADVGADHITFHIESDDPPEEVFEAIEGSGCSAGLCLKPKTSYDKILPYIERCDLILVMTVEPGFGGQKFMADMMPKVREIRNIIEKKGLKTHLEVDGGIDSVTVKEAVRNGANLLVAGTSVFRSPLGYKRAIDSLRISQIEN